MNKMTLLLLTASCLGAGAALAQSAEPQPAVKPVRCAPSTGTRLSSTPNAQGVCEDGTTPVRSYSREDLERTGQTNLDEALSQLDPSVTRGGGGAGGVR